MSFMSTPASMMALAGFTMPGFRSGTVSLLVNGLLYEGWLSVDISRSIKKMAGEATFKVSERWSGGAGGPSSLIGWRIRPGDACVVLYSGIPVLTGYVEVYNPKYNATSHDVTIQVRSKTGDLCDCSAEADVKNGEMRDVNLEQMARKVVKNYGIDVTVEADASHRFDLARVHPGETVHEWLERYARPGAVLPTDTGAGGLLLKQVEHGDPVSSLIEGVNVLEASSTLRADNRFSEYKVKGQDHGRDNEFGKRVAQRSASATDPSIKRYRPLHLLNETKTSNKDAKSRADWEQASRAGESVKVEASVVDWMHAPGKLWTPGDKVLVSSPMLAVNRVLALKSVKYHQSDKNGTTTKLSLTPVEALNPKAGAKPPKGGNDAMYRDTRGMPAVA